MITLDDLLSILRDEYEQAGSRTAWAKAHDISPAYVSDVLNKKREPGHKILDALGFERSATTYQRVRHATGKK